MLGFPNGVTLHVWVRVKNGDVYIGKPQGKKFLYFPAKVNPHLTVCFLILHRYHTFLLNAPTWLTEMLPCAAHVTVTNSPCALWERTHGGNSGVESMVLMVVFMGTTSAVLCSLFGQLQRWGMTSAAEVNPDTLVQGATTVWANTICLDDFLTVLLNVMQMLVCPSFISGLFQINYYINDHRGSSLLFTASTKVSTLKTSKWWNYTKHCTIFTH